MEKTSSYIASFKFHTGLLEMGVIGHVSFFSRVSNFVRFAEVGFRYISNEKPFASAQNVRVHIRAGLLFCN